MSYCTKCGKEVAQGSSFCPKCGDQLSNIQSDMQSTPGSAIITEQEYFNFIWKNADKYLTKFKKFNSGGTDGFSATWHWPAFFVPFFWMLYRKLYLWALLVFVIAIIPVVNFTFPFLMILFGITSNYIYYKHTRKKLLEIKLVPSSEIQKAVNIAHQGGVNSAIVIVVAIWFIFSGAILAAIAIPQFLEFKKRGACVSAKADLKNAYTTSQAYFLNYPKGNINNADDLKDYGFQKSGKVLVQIKGTANSLLITASHPDCDKTYVADSGGNIQEEIKP